MTGSHEVRGSIPLGSTNNFNNLGHPSRMPFVHLCALVCQLSKEQCLADLISCQFLVRRLSCLFLSSRLCQHTHDLIMSAFGCQHQSRLAFIILRTHLSFGNE
jgi:hypothetical protein